MERLDFPKKFIHRFFDVEAILACGMVAQTLLRKKLRGYDDPFRKSSLGRVLA